MKKINENYMFICLGCLCIFLASLISLTSSISTRKSEFDTAESVSYSEFLDDWANEEFDCVWLDGSSDVYYEVSDGTWHQTMNPRYDDFVKELLSAGIDVNDSVTKSSIMTQLFFSLITGIVTLFFGLKSVFGTGKKNTSGLAYNARGASGKSNVKNGVSKKNKTEFEPSTTFKDVAGLYELKDSMKELVSFLTEPEMYREAGAKLPKGVIMYGPPGTGKTLMARAIAGEAQVPFYYASGSSFVEKFVGVGASRVRELFAEANKHVPCIVFIDELDALGSERGKNGNEEQNQTIDEFLTAMDGFIKNDGVLVIGATNRLDNIDKALLRAGRFSSHYCVPLPETVKERREIIDMYAKNKKFTEDVDFDSLAKETAGLSPADIENLLNISAIKSVKENNGIINRACIDSAVYEMLLEGHMKKDFSERDKEEVQIIAYHEAAHAVVSNYFGKEVTKVTIIPSTTGAGGVTFKLSQSNRLKSKENYEQAVMEMYGGRAGEYLYFNGNTDKITDGAANDIKRASELIDSYVSEHGFVAEVGWLNVDAANLNKENLDSLKKEIAKRLESETIRIVQDNSEAIVQIANLLCENNTVYASELSAILADKQHVDIQ